MTNQLLARIDTGEHRPRREWRDQTISAPETRRKRYEIVSRLSSSLTSGAPEDWIRDLAAELRGALHFDRLEVVVYKEQQNEIQWRFPARSAPSRDDVPIEETLLEAVH